MANGKIRFGKQSGGELALVIPDGVNNTEVIVPESGILITKQYVDDIITSLSDEKIGQPFYDYYLRTDCLAFSGGEYYRSEFPKFWNYLSNNLKDKIATETDYKNYISLYGACGFFSLGNGSTTFRMPNLQDIYLKNNQNIISGTIGLDRIRNIKGTIQSTWDEANGAFYNNSVSGNLTADGDGTGVPYCRKAFDASRVVPVGETNEPRNMTMILQCKVK